MRKCFAVVALCGSLSTAEAARADGHLVSPANVQDHLAESADARARNLATLDRVLSSPRAPSAAAVAGVDLRAVRGALATLSDAELRDLVARSAALQTDPAAGLSSDVNQLLIIFLIVAIVILVLKNV
jgi:hypothetical protein